MADVVPAIRSPGRDPGRIARTSPTRSAAFGLAGPGIAGESCSVRIASDRQVVDARRECRRLASRAGFSAADITLVTMVVSELARNMLLYAWSGILTASLVTRGGRPGIQLIAADAGPGIADVGAALRDGFSTSGRPGLGLPGIRRIVDSFEIDSGPDRGTTVVAIKLLR